MGAPTVGRKAPVFALPDHDGALASLADFVGRTVILYFYPKDDTETCTKQACAFRDAMPDFAALDAVVLGVSPDTPKSHAKFRAKYDLPFTLLADEDHAVAKRYGVWREKRLYGRTYMGIVRSTFVIDPQGRIRAVFESVRVKGHVEKLASELERLPR